MDVRIIFSDLARFSCNRKDRHGVRFVWRYLSSEVELGTGALGKVHEAQHFRPVIGLCTHTFAQFIIFGLTSVSTVSPHQVHKHDVEHGLDGSPHNCENIEANCFYVGCPYGHNPSYS